MMEQYEGPLKGKKWVVIGDSFTAGVTGTVFTDGPCTGKPFNYAYCIAERTGVEVIPFYQGGRTLAYPDGSGFENSVTCPTTDCFYQRIPQDADYITIMLGINDSHHAPKDAGDDGEVKTGIIPIGTLEDATTATYCGAWNVVLTWLRTNRPFAHVGIIVTNGCDTDAYREVQIAMARGYGYPYIDLNGDEHTPCMIRSRNPEIPERVKLMVMEAQAVDLDGSKTGKRNTHPNDTAHAFASRFIESFLLRL